SDRIMPLMFGETFMSSDAATQRRQLWRRRLEANTNDIYRAVNGILYRPSIQSELPNIEVPTLVMHGEQDRAIPIEEGRDLADSIPSAEFVSVPESGHSMAIERPELVSETLDDFLDDV
ncbi:MAG: alpha/beta fold hydrolase, partial [Bradymonadaceae bacterium]